MLRTQWYRIGTQTCFRPSSAKRSEKSALSGGQGRWSGAGAFEQRPYFEPGRLRLENRTFFTAAESSTSGIRACPEKTIYH